MNSPSKPMDAIAPSSLPEDPRNGTAFTRIYLKSFGSDICMGAEEVTFLITGRRDKKAVRATYHLHEKSNIPTFTWGSRVCARKSTVSAWIWAQERRIWQDDNERETLVKLNLLLNAALPLFDQMREHELDEHQREDLKALAADAVAVIGQFLRIASR